MHLAQGSLLHLLVSVVCVLVVLVLLGEVEPDA
jgi:hypothetical protein